MALLAPYVNSYRRYVPDFAAPDQSGMGPRQPHHGPSHPDLQRRGAPGGKPPAGHGLQPLSRHRGHAGLRLSGPDGTRRGPRPNSAARAYIDSERYPGPTLATRWTCWTRTRRLQEVVGRRFRQGLDSVKRNEYKEFLQVISPWETGASAVERLTLNLLHANDRAGEYPASYYAATRPRRLPPSPPCKGEVRRMSASWAAAIPACLPRCIWRRRACRVVRAGGASRWLWRLGAQRRAGRIGQRQDQDWIWNGWSGATMPAACGIWPRMQRRWSAT